MLTNIKKGDLRIVKTEKALSKAMFSLLKHQKFEKITVRDICEEALISRSAFYAHFDDKYDLLKYWLTQLRLENIKGDGTYEQMEKAVNDFIYENEIIIKNIVYDATGETLDILFAAMLSVLNLIIEETGNEKTNPKYIVQSNIYAGGLVYYLLWLVKNNFPPDVVPMNTYLFEIIKKFRGL